MNKINVESTDDFLKSKEMAEFFSQLEAIKTNAILRIKLGKNEDEMKRRVKNEIELLIHTNRMGNHDCPAGQIWDDELNKCVKF